MSRERLRMRAVPVSSESTVALPAGVALHARPAATFVKTALRFRSRLTVGSDGKVADAKSILAVLALGATGGTVLRLSAEGEDAPDALEALARCVSGLVEQPLFGGEAARREVKASDPSTHLAHARSRDAELVHSHSDKNRHRRRIRGSLATNVDDDSSLTTPAHGRVEESQNSHIGHRGRLRLLTVQAEQELRQIVGADAEEVRDVGNLGSSVRRLGGLDHRTDLWRGPAVEDGRQNLMHSSDLSRAAHHRDEDPKADTRAGVEDGRELSPQRFRRFEQQLDATAGSALQKSWRLVTAKVEEAYCHDLFLQRREDEAEKRCLLRTGRPRFRVKEQQLSAKQPDALGSLLERLHNLANARCVREHPDPVTILCLPTLHPVGDRVVARGAPVLRIGLRRCDAACFGLAKKNTRVAVQNHLFPIA